MTAVLTTTLNLIRQYRPCSDGWEKLLKNLGKTAPDDEPINLLQILNSNGVADCLWALRATVEDCSVVARLIAADCTESVLPLYETRYPDDLRPRRAIETARRYALGEATSKELAAARDAAWSAERDASAAARAAVAAARAAAWVAAIDAMVASAAAMSAQAAADSTARAAVSAAGAASWAVWDAACDGQAQIVRRYLR